jgi:hypothetical protein
MTTISVTPAMRRKAEALAELVPMLPRGRSKINGQGFYIIPSSEKPLTVAHYASDLGCTCEGFRRRGTCTHQLACAIVLQRAEAASIAAHQSPAKKSAQQIYTEAGPFGPCCHTACAAAATGKNRRCAEHFQKLLDSLGY